MGELGMWKPVLTALAVPPVPWIALALWGGWRLWRGKGDGWLWSLLAAVALWLSSCMGSAIFLQDVVLKVPHALKEADRQRLSRLVQEAQPAKNRGAGRTAPAATPVAIVVLGGGLQPLAPEYGLASLTEASLLRLRYGLWLSQQTGAPVGFSGGIGWGQKGPADGPSEAEVAERIAAQEFGIRLRWVESQSADTQANAERTMALLAEQGVQRVVLVTSAYHLPRAVHWFERAAKQEAARRPGMAPIVIEPAGTAYWRMDLRPLLEWMPSGQGATAVHAAWREVLGGLVQR